jgi:hypothetical protein
MESQNEIEENNNENDEAESYLILFRMIYHHILHNIISSFSYHDFH